MGGAAAERGLCCLCCRCSTIRPPASGRARGKGTEDREQRQQQLRQQADRERSAAAAVVVSVVRRRRRSPVARRPPPARSLARGHALPWRPPRNACVLRPAAASQPMAASATRPPHAAGNSGGWRSWQRSSLRASGAADRLSPAARRRPLPASKRPSAALWRPSPRASLCAPLRFAARCCPCLSPAALWRPVCCLPGSLSVLAGPAACWPGRALMATLARPLARPLALAAVSRRRRLRRHSTLVFAAHAAGTRPPPVPSHPSHQRTHRADAVRLPAHAIRSSFADKRAAHVSGTKRLKSWSQTADSRRKTQDRLRPRSHHHYVLRDHRRRP